MTPYINENHQEVLNYTEQTKGAKWKAGETNQ